MVLIYNIIYVNVRRCECIDNLFITVGKMSSKINDVSHLLLWPELVMKIS